MMISYAYDVHVSDFDRCAGRQHCRQDWLDVFVCASAIVSVEDRQTGVSADVGGRWDSHRPHTVPCPQRQRVARSRYSGRSADRPVADSCPALPSAPPPRAARWGLPLFCHHRFQRLDVERLLGDDVLQQPSAGKVASASPYEPHLVPATLDARFLPDLPWCLIGDPGYDSDGLVAQTVLAIVLVLRGRLDDPLR